MEQTRKVYVRELGSMTSHIGLFLSKDEDKGTITIQLASGEIKTVKYGTFTFYPDETK
jgi:hypothetical protein